MRLFTAIELPEPVRAHLANLNETKDTRALVAGQGERDVRFSRTRPENLHVTLKFLGAVDEADVPALCQALGTIGAERSSDVWAGHVELLPPRGPVRVIAAGLDGDGGRLELLYRDVEARCDELGFPRERRPYRPHITLQRCRTPLPPAVRDELPSHFRSQFPGPRFRVDSFVLFESRLHGDAPQYIRLANFPLKRESESGVRSDWHANGGRAE